MRATLSVAFFIFSKFGVSFLGQKRAVGKWEGCTVISKNGLFFRRMFSFGHSRCLPIEEGNMSALSAKYFFCKEVVFSGVLLPTTWRDFDSLLSEARWWLQAPPRKFIRQWVDFAPFKCPDMWKVSSSNKYISEISSPRVYKSTPESRN